MEIPFDGILTLLIFLVGIPALVLQLISAAERRAAMKSNGLDVQSFLRQAIAIIIIGFVLQFAFGYWLTGKPDIRDGDKKLIEQFLWLLIFIPLFYLAIQVSQRIPEQYGRRERIVEKLTQDVLQEAQKKGRIGGGAFADLADLGKQCDPGQERQMVVNALMMIVKAMIASPFYRGDSFETLIDELVHMLASDPEPKDLNNYDLAIKILSAILSTHPQAESDYDRQRAVHAVSKLGQSLIVHFKSVERDNIMLDYIDSLELALLRREMLTEISQALFEIGVCAVREKQDFVFIAVLDKMTTLAGNYPELPGEFITDLLGLLSHYWTEVGSRRQFAQDRFNGVRGFLKKPITAALERSRNHLISSMYFDEADKLGQMAEDIRRDDEERKKREGKLRKRK
jgi:hypothetical protein